MSSFKDLMNAETLPGRYSYQGEDTECEVKLTYREPCLVYVEIGGYGNNFTKRELQELAMLLLVESNRLNDYSAHMQSEAARLAQPLQTIEAQSLRRYSTMYQPRSYSPYQALFGET